jgi:DNA-binding transcriptional MerR regulator
MAFTVKAVAELAGITIRTLHHYDEIGLLKPAQVTAAGYRLYTADDLEQLQQILFFRELGFTLHAIKELISRPGFNRKQALAEHRQLLQERQLRLGRLIASIDHTLNTMEGAIPMAAKDVKAMFDGFDHTEYEEEARQRWGDSQEYQESVTRTKNYTKADWAAFKAEMAEITATIASLMDRDHADPDVQAQVRRWHQFINDRCYTCSTEVFRGLGDLYVADERFTATYDETRPGMAEFMQAAMNVYCDTLEGK